MIAYLGHRQTQAQKLLGYAGSVECRLFLGLDFTLDVELYGYEERKTGQAGTGDQ